MFGDYSSSAGYADHRSQGANGGFAGSGPGGQGISLGSSDGGVMNGGWTAPRLSTSTESNPTSTTFLPPTPQESTAWPHINAAPYEAPYTPAPTCQTITGYGEDNTASRQGRGAEDAGTHRQHWAGSHHDNTNTAQSYDLPPASAPSPFDGLTSHPPPLNPSYLSASAPANILSFNAPSIPCTPQIPMLPLDITPMPSYRTLTDPKELITHQGTFFNPAPHSARRVMPSTPRPFTSTSFPSPRMRPQRSMLSLAASYQDNAHGGIYGPPHSAHPASGSFEFQQGSGYMAAAPPAALPPWTVASAGAKKTLKMRSKSYANLAGVRSHPYGAQSSAPPLPSPTRPVSSRSTFSELPVTPHLHSSPDTPIADPGNVYQDDVPDFDQDFGRNTSAFTIGARDSFNDASLPKPAPPFHSELGKSNTALPPNIPTRNMARGPPVQVWQDIARPAALPPIAGVDIHQLVNRILSTPMESCTTSPIRHQGTSSLSAHSLHATQPARGVADADVWTRDGKRSASGDSHSDAAYSAPGAPETHRPSTPDPAAGLGQAQPAGAPAATAPLDRNIESGVSRKQFEWTDQYGITYLSPVNPARRPIVATRPKPEFKVPDVPLLRTKPPPKDSKRKREHIVGDAEQSASEERGPAPNVEARSAADARTVAPLPAARSAISSKSAKESQVIGKGAAAGKDHTDPTAQKGSKKLRKLAPRASGSEEDVNMDVGPDTIDVDALSLEDEYGKKASYAKYKKAETEKLRRIARQDKTQLLRQALIQTTPEQATWDRITILDKAYEAVKEVQQLRLDQKARIDEQRRNRDELERLNALIEELRRDKEEAELRHREEMAAGGGLSAFP